MSVGDPPGSSGTYYVVAYPYRIPAIVVDGPLNEDEAARMIHAAVPDGRLIEADRLVREVRENGYRVRFTDNCAIPEAIKPVVR